MGFNEKVHAYIAARYYVRLTEEFSERGLRAFIHGTQYYAEQRGRRMAQRAIRDGRELNFETYMQYGEWVSTDEVKALGCDNHGEIVSRSPDYRKHIDRCPWATQFKEMGLVEAGMEYCRHLDNSICRGYNPYLSYVVSDTLHTSDYCVQSVKDAFLPDDFVYEYRPELLKSFEYHCAHSYWAYRDTVSAIFGEAGKLLSEAVLADFTETYGQEMATVLLGYENVNFDLID